MPRRRRRRTMRRVLAIAALLLGAALVSYAAFSYEFSRVWSKAHPATTGAPQATREAVPAPGGEDFSAGERRGLDDVLRRKAKEHP